MDNVKRDKYSKTEENYLKNIYELQLDNKDLVMVRDIALRLEVSAASVTEMIKRLEKKDLVIYESYKGVRLSEKGLLEARFILKAHRIWEYFLLKKLNYHPDQVHEDAENLEHDSSPLLVERLWEYLEYPTSCPHGSPIPTESFYYHKKKRVSIDKAPLNTILNNSEYSEKISNFINLFYHNLVITFIEIIEKYQDSSILIKINNQNYIVVPFEYQKEWTVDIYEK